MLSFVFHVLVASSLAFPFKDAEIVGGNPVSPPFRYPWIATIFYNQKHWCGATLLDSETILTASHCSSKELGPALKVYSHRFDLNATAESENALEYEVVKIIKHPKFNQWNYRFDVAVWKIKLVKGDPNSMLPAKIKFDDGSLQAAGTLLKVAGWGATTAGGPQSKILLEVAVPVTKDEVCLDAYGDLELDETSFCAGYSDGGRDSCSGDSGGPLFQENEMGITLVGTVSYGRGCASKSYPGVYSRVSKSADWIKSLMKQ